MYHSTVISDDTIHEVIMTDGPKKRDIGTILTKTRASKANRKASASVSEKGSVGEGMMD